MNLQSELMAMEFIHLLWPSILQISLDINVGVWLSVILGRAGRVDSIVKFIRFEETD
jgi:hypothetical protein